LGVPHAHIQLAHIVLGNNEAEEEGAGDEAAPAAESGGKQHEGRWTDTRTIAENRRGSNIELELTAQWMPVVIRRRASSYVFGE